MRFKVIGFSKVFYGSKNQQNEKNKIDNLNLNKNYKEISNNITIIQSKFFKAQSSKAQSSKLIAHNSKLIAQRQKQKTKF